MPSRLFCRLCWSNMTRLLNTPIIGSTDRDRAFLVDRHAGRAVAMGDAQHAALLLGPGRGRRKRGRQQSRDDEMERP